MVSQRQLSLSLPFAAPNAKAWLDPPLRKLLRLVRGGAGEAFQLVDLEEFLAAELQMRAKRCQGRAADLLFQRVHAVEFRVVGAGQRHVAAALLRQIDAL